jgi:hypothetical protein
MGPLAPIVTGITFVFALHIRCISLVKSLYFKISWAFYLTTFASPEITVSNNGNIPLSVSRILMSGLLLGMVLPIGVIWGGRGKRGASACPIFLYLRILFFGC